MTQGQLEKLPLTVQKQWAKLEQRIMRDIIRRIKINGFGTASASWQITRLQQLGESDEQIKKWLQEALKASNEEIEKIFSDEAYKQYMEEGRGYQLFGKKQVPFDDNGILQSTIDAMTSQAQNEFENLANSASFAIRDPNGHIHYTPLAEFYRETVDGAIMDIESGAFTYQQVLERTVSSLTNSGLGGWVDYDSGWRNRVDVAVRRSVLSGWRQIQGKISEQTAADLGTDSYEVTVHVGARPSHQEWEGKVWTMQQLIDVCGLGTVTGLHGANCYHDYYPFIPGISERTYTDEQLKQIHDEENATKTYKGKEYTTYDALQKQRELETRCRALSEKIDLLEHGESDQDAIILQKAKYKATLAEYKAFSDKMDLPMQRQRITQNGLKVDLKGIGNLADAVEKNSVSGIISASGKSTLIASVKIPNDEIKYKIINEAIDAKKPVYADDLRKVFDKVKPKVGCMDIVLHGAPTFAEYEHTYMLDAETLAKIITSRRDYNPLNEIRLLSCSTGKADKNGNCFAQELANITGHDVYAPIDVLNIGYDGKLTVGEREELSEALGFKWFRAKG